MGSQHRNPCRYVLIAGDEYDLPAIRRLLGGLPEDTYGQVFVEILTERVQESLPAPERVAVTWLVRSRRASRIPLLPFADRGEPLAAALAGWATEWLAGADEQSAEHPLMWIGVAESAHVAAVQDLLLGPVYDQVRSLDDALDDRFG
ncbi:hypothetical protein GCM10011575_13050 [Microlunatus endophyticus]|uniref:SIP-like Rossmann fold domain-containing protein n=1 Tax=Microlunatus endophyticus TaxID=1716077 RepID=A0A917W2Q7_9ACTN|nr:SIP domain-containing protein [Microlunatus endophyticus]GGL56069.1 hypothetical protein GCM10011575_13050 [Microlunatus endophyticus]